MIWKCRLILLSLVFAPLVQAQSAAVSQPACTAAEHRQFDFWLGEWDVSLEGAPGKVIGHNTISRVSEGCALLEHWRNSTGKEGRSLNVYEADRRQWTQFWVGADGVVLRLSGTFHDDAMVLSGVLGQQLQRVTWTPGTDGSVSQHWQVSDDNGQNWTTSFHGIYRRK